MTSSPGEQKVLANRRRKNSIRCFAGSLAASEYPAPTRRTEDGQPYGRRIPDRERQNRPGPEYYDEATLQLDADAAARYLDHQWTGQFAIQRRCPTTPEHRNRDHHGWA